MRIVLDTNCLLASLSNAPTVEFIEPFYRFNLITQDPDDNKFVDCAIAGNATYIVSNDSHFDVLKQTDFPKLVVKRIQEFSTLLAAASNNAPV